MKKALMAAFLLVAVIFGSAVYALAGDTPALTVNVPFAFYAGKQLLPAGEYRITMLALNYSATGSILAIGTKDGSLLMYLSGNPSDSRGNEPAYTAKFKKYGGRYFLSEVQNGWRTSALPKTRAEKELAIADASKPGGSAAKDVVLNASTPE